MTIWRDFALPLAGAAVSGVTWAWARVDTSAVEAVRVSKTASVFENLYMTCRSCWHPASGCLIPYPVGPESLFPDRPHLPAGNGEDSIIRLYVAWFRGAVQ